MVATQTAPSAARESRVAEVIAALDAALQLPRSCSFQLFERDIPEAEYAFCLWASAHELPLQYRDTPYEGGKIKTLSILRADGIFSVATLQFEVQP